VRRRQLDDTIQCQICGRILKVVNSAHLKTHGVTVPDYKEEFGIGFVMNEQSRANISNVHRRSGSERFIPMERDEIFQRLRQFATANAAFSGNWLRKKSPVLLRQAIHLFGSWNAAMIAIGKEPFKTRTWSKEAVIKQLREIHKNEPERLWRNIQEHGHLYAAARYVFGGWDKAVRAAGFPYTKKRRRKRDRQSLLDALRAWHRKHGSLNTSRMKKTDPALLSASRRAFGSLEAAAHASNVPYVTYRRDRWSKRAVDEEIQSVRKSGRSLRPRSLAKECRGLYKAACKFYGSWRAALQANGLNDDEAMEQRRRTRKNVARDLRAWCDEHGQLTSSALWKMDPALCSAAQHRWGSMAMAARALKLSYVRLNKGEWSRRRVIRELKARRQAGEAMNPSALRKAAPRLYSAAERYCGGLKSAMCAAGIEYVAWNGRRSV
jgi:hypothetical protein